MFPAESHRRALDLVAGAILERVPFIAMTGNKEDQADAGLLQHVVEGVDPAVAGTIRDGKSRVVKRSYKSGAIALWRKIDHAELIG